MKHTNLYYLSIIRKIMVLVNFINILFLAAIVLFTSKYIIENQLAREFLERIFYMPKSPELVFWGSILLFGVLVYLMYHRDSRIIEHKIVNNIYNFGEAAICFAIIYLLYMTYNGLILLIFCDCIYNFKDDKYAKYMLIALIGMYLITNWDIFTYFMPLMNFQQYFQIYDVSFKNLLLIGKNILEMLNILLFIIFMSVYLVGQIQENKYISRKLTMISIVNQKLQRYAVATEKIGENNERKRLAREIHDTVGHALAGVAAGIDACIVMIDTNPEATKKQLKVISKVVRQGMVDVRKSLNRLRPGALEKQGFKEAIEKMINEFASIGEVDISLDYRLENLDLENTTEDILFRTIQESMTNSVRHGGASKIDIALYLKDGNLCLTIKDNGIGCENITYGFGLKQMKERIAVINGTVKFKGTDGFAVLVKIPIIK
ncbi:sensor histidine kinase [Megamonas hypermegale]|uniref:sensor histidine kinase n=1 Tax=Megamonas hypermegale TaxID=158847 RepID=UPI0025A36FCC|nr:sensor histidine kinase [Megamonas hypermegale]MDM8143292.1 sensor histidine kinase [Megamonas hypermegale]